MKICWADLHNHNEIGYGVGTLQRSYDLAEASLDVFAFIPHGHWPDPPGDDPKLLAYHEAGFERVSRRFDEVLHAANARYRPGEFVSFVGFEWHSSEWGDYQVIFPGATGSLFKADTLHELQAFARREDALLIQHHIGYRRGWRGANWDAQDAALTPVVEVFSEHGNSFDPISHHGMTEHSMGGTTRSQTALAQLIAGRRFGLIASTDTHNGHPASYDEGLAAILTDDLTREGVFAAIRARHTYAVSGDRIALELGSGGAIVGDVLPRSARREIRLAVDPLAPLEFVKLLRNGRTAQVWAPELPADSIPSAGSWIVRVDFGWDRLESSDLTLWNLDIGLEDAAFEAAHPCFSGGPAGKGHLNRIIRKSPQNLRVEAFTSRDNPVPVSGVVLRINAAGNFRLKLSGSTDTAGQAGGFELETTLGELLKHDLWAQVLPRFSAPKLRIGCPWRVDELRFDTTWCDPAPCGEDFYMLKVQQANGQMAWSTPIWFSDRGD